MFTRFYAGEISPKELEVLARFESEDLGEWFRELSKGFWEKGLFDVKYSDEQLEVMKPMFLNGTITAPYLGIMMKWFPDVFLDWFQEWLCNWLQ